MQFVLICWVSIYLSFNVVCLVKDPPPDIAADDLSTDETTDTTTESTTTIETTTVIHGKWGDWGQWTSCSVYCGTGSRYRNRVCDNPPPGENGDDCEGSSEDLGTCNLGECCAPKVFDLVFLIDVTDSSRFDNVKTFFGDVTDLFSIGPSATRVSTVLSSSTETIMFSFTDYSSASAIKAAINGISSSSSTSNPKSALNFVRSDVLTDRNGARSDISDVVIMYVTHDSYSYDSWFLSFFIDDEPKEAAKKLTANGVYFIVAEGNSESEFQLIANVYEGFTSFRDSVKSSFYSKIENGFPCNYFCGTSVFALDSPENLGSGNDSSAGFLYLMTDSAYQITCCGATSTWEFYSVNQGVVEVMIFRNTGRYSYYLVGSTRIVVPEEYVGKTVSFNLLAAERVAIVEGDFLGWHTSGPNIIGHADCTGDNCPQNNKMLHISRANFDDGDTLDFTNASTISNRGYSLKLATTDNTELHIIPIQNETEVEENIPLGFKVMYFRVTDTDLGDNITMSLAGTNSHHFALSSVQFEQVSMTLREKLPEGPSGPYILTVIGQDSCRHSASTTVTVSTYNAPPVVHNLPHIMEIAETVKEPVFLYGLNVSDVTNDPICCTLSHTLPVTYNFQFKHEGGVYSIWTSDNPAFSYADLDSYRIFVCCQDNFGSTSGYLIIRLTETKEETTFVPPGWFTTAIAVSMLPISFMTILTFATLIVTMFCIDPPHEVENTKQHQDAFGNEMHLQESEKGAKPDVSSKSLSSFVIECEEPEVKTKSRRDTIYFKNMYTDEEFFIPVWRTRNGDRAHDIPIIEQSRGIEDRVRTANESSDMDSSASYGLKSKSINEFGVELKLFHYGRKPLLEKPDKERAVTIFRKKNEIKQKWQEAIAKAELVKKQKELDKKLVQSNKEHTETEALGLIKKDESTESRQSPLYTKVHVKPNISVDTVDMKEHKKELVIEQRDLYTQRQGEKSVLSTSQESFNSGHSNVSRVNDVMTSDDLAEDEDILSVFDAIVVTGDAPIGTTKKK